MKRSRVRTEEHTPVSDIPADQRSRAEIDRAIDREPKILRGGPQASAEALKLSAEQLKPGPKPGSSIANGSCCRGLSGLLS